MFHVKYIPMWCSGTFGPAPQFEQILIPYRKAAILAEINIVLVKKRFLTDERLLTYNDDGRRLISDQIVHW